jgi:hypothetical protein
MKAFFDKFGGLKSASFIGIENYTNKYDEVANISLLTNVDVRNAKEKDLATLKSLTPADLKDISKANDLPMDVLETALSELIASGEKNLSSDMSERTNQSKAQADAYVHLTPAVRLHKDSMNVFVSGFLNSKTVLVEGEYPQKNKRVKTICKEAIGKHCDLRMNKYRQYNVGSMDRINITGSTLQFIRG